jgi:methylated-DNA-[protein]-cysteine S-methyltransferase
MDNAVIGYYKSPIGVIEIVCKDKSITSLNFIDEEMDKSSKSNLYVEKCSRQLDEYFEGKRKGFDIDFIIEGTDFQKKVCQAILTVPYGLTKTYMEISKIVGDVLAIRAIASAHGQNKLPIIIPCHRVIGSDGSLTGYAGGLWRKKWLLEHEQKFSGAEHQLTLSF